MVREAGQFNEGLAVMSTWNRAGALGLGYVDIHGSYVLEPRTVVVGASQFSENQGALTVSRSWYERLNPLN